MFWIGMIVGIILGAVALLVAAGPLCCKIYNASIEEIYDGFNLVAEAGHNRECELILVKDDTTIEVVEFLND